jgi:putative oxidoreductase
MRLASCVKELTMLRWYGYNRGAGSVGLLVLRLTVGAAFIIHGWGKIQQPLVWMNGWFEGPPPPYLQAAAAVAEFGGGIAWVIGLLTPLFSLMIACTMATAIAIRHWPHGDPFVNPQGGPSFELAAAYLAVAICLLLLGPGQFSLDYCIFGRRATSKDLRPYAVQ